MYKIDTAFWQYCVMLYIVMYTFDQVQTHDPAYVIHLVDGTKHGVNGKSYHEGTSVICLIAEMQALLLLANAHVH